MEPVCHKRLLGAIALVGILLGTPFVCLRIVSILWPARWLILSTIAAVEWCFYIFYYRRTYEDFNKIPSKCEPDDFSPAEAQRNWSRFLSCVRTLPGGVDPYPYLTQWFCNALFDDIRRGNVEEMLVYGFWYRKRSDMTGDLSHIPGQMVDQLQQVLGVKFPPGYTPCLKFMSHLWEDLRAGYRPLCLYLGMEVLHGAQRLIMASYGFKAKHMGLLGYYTLNCGVDFPDSTAAAAAAAAAADDDDDGWTPFAVPQPPPAARAASNPLHDAVPAGRDKATPVMFLHGVGGLMLYLEMLKHVIGLGHPVIVIEYKHVAMRLSSYIPTVDEVTETVVRILDAEGIPRVCVVGHSYGSFMASRLNSLHPGRLHAICLIDPVCLGMFMPHLLHNFMYRRPRVDWKHPDVLVRDLALWFASRDVHIAATFARRFYWSDLNLWPEDLPPGSCVVLSGNDDLCSAGEVKKMLEAAGHTKVILNPHLFHGAFLLDPASKAHLMVEVKALLASSGSLVVRLARPVMDRTLSAARSLLHEVETLKTRLSHSHSPDSVGQGQGVLRRTLTDLPARTWHRLSSFTGANSAEQHGCRAGAAAGAGTGGPAASPNSPMSPANTPNSPAAAAAAEDGVAASGDSSSSSRHRKNLSTIPSGTEDPSDSSSSIKQGGSSGVGANGQHSQGGGGSWMVNGMNGTVGPRQAAAGGGQGEAGLDAGSCGAAAAGHTGDAAGAAARDQARAQPVSGHASGKVGLLMQRANTKASRLMRRALTTMTGPDRQGAQHAAGGDAAQQQQLQQQLQQEAQQLQQVLQQKHMQQ